MFDLLKQKGDYPLRKLLGIDLHKDTLKSLQALSTEQEFVLLSQLQATESNERLALLGSDVPPELLAKLSRLLQPEHLASRPLPQTKIYAIRQVLMQKLRARSLEILPSGHLFLKQEQVLLSKEEVNELIFEFQLQALHPVLVFPETTPLFIKTPKLLSGLAHRGALFLLDWQSLSGDNGHLSYKIALHLLENESVMGIGFKSTDFKNLSSITKVNKAALRYLEV